MQVPVCSHPRLGSRPNPLRHSEICLTHEQSEIVQTHLNLHVCLTTPCSIAIGRLTCSSCASSVSQTVKRTTRYSAQTSSSNKRTAGPTQEVLLILRRQWREGDRGSEEGAAERTIRKLQRAAHAAGAAGGGGGLAAGPSGAGGSGRGSEGVAECQGKLRRSGRLQGLSPDNSAADDSGGGGGSGGHESGKLVAGGVGGLRKRGNRSGETREEGGGRRKKVS